MGTPQVIGEIRGRPVESAIAKSPVTVEELQLDLTNLAGDRQADLTVHGGPDKAVYAYPGGHYPDWQEDGFHVGPGSMGENLTLAGPTEQDVRIGDVWRWGDALVQVSQPRAPCYKLSLHTGRKDVGPRMIATRRSGWYLRVLRPGTVPTTGALELDDRADDAPTVHQTFAVTHAPRSELVPGTDQHAAALRIVAAGALAEQWREALSYRLGGGDR